MVTGSRNDRRLTEPREATAKVIALAGNPNVGKSTLFNALTGLRQHTGNWPGKTVAVAEGTVRLKGEKITLVDLPGAYSLSSHSPEEEIARDFIQSGRASLVLVVCDASSLERCLPLVMQIQELGARTAVCVNLMDEAERRGIHLDLSVLARRLGVPVVGVSARDKRSLSPLLKLLEEALADVPGVDREDSAASSQAYLSQSDARTLERARTAASIAAEAVRCQRAEPDRRDRRLDRILTGRLLGYPLMLLLLGLIFYITIRGANYPSELLSRALFGLGDRLSALLLALGAPSWLHDALILGAYRMLAWVIGVMLPPMAIFFPLFTLLEDIGYLPRVAFNLDRPFHRCRACGKQALTMAMGFGCNAAGVTGCRIIDSPRERLLAILTNSFVPCNGRFPILLLLIGLFFSSHPAATAAMMTGLVLLGIAVTLLITRLLSATLLRGESSSFALELPPYRMPQWGQVLARSLLDRTLFVLGRAAAVAAPAGLLLWIMANVQVGEGPLLGCLAARLEGAGRFFGMDGTILLAFILGFPANETVLPIALMIYLSQSSLSSGASVEEIRSILITNGWTWVTAGCTALFALMHWPCSTTLLTVRKETGKWSWTLLAALLPTVCGLSACLVFRLIAACFTAA